MEVNPFTFTQNTILALSHYCCLGAPGIFQPRFLFASVVTVFLGSFFSLCIKYSVFLAMVSGEMAFLGQKVVGSHLDKQKRKGYIRFG